MKGVWQLSYAVGGWAHGFIIMPLPPSHELTQIWEVSWNLYHCWVWANQDDIVQWLRLLLNMEWFPHPLPTCQVLDNVHMLWMGTAINLNAVTNTCVNPDVGSPSTFYITAVWQRMTLCCGWGSYPAWNGSHIPSNHMKGIWQLSYAVNGHMGPCYHANTTTCVDPADEGNQLES